MPRPEDRGGSLPLTAVQEHAFVLNRLWMLQLEPNSILRALRALRGEFSSTSGLAPQPASVPCEPKLEATTHSTQEGNRNRLLSSINRATVTA